MLVMGPDNQFAEQYIELLRKTRALALSPERPFRYASGLFGPIYCDNRKLISNPEVRKKASGIAADYLKEKIRAPELKTLSIGAMATGAVPLGMLISELLDLPFYYIRPNPKAHGKEQLLEGDWEEKQKLKLLIIEDLINQASSLECALKHLCSPASQAAGIEVRAVFSFVNYQSPKARERITSWQSDWGLSLFSLTTLDDILIFSNLDDEQKQVLQNWRNNPTDWSRAYENDSLK